MKLEVEDLTVTRGGEVLAAGLSFSVSSGRALTIEGANGAGKSSLLRVLAGLLEPQRGRVSLVEKPDTFREDELESLCHYLGHDNAMKPALSVQDNLAFWRSFLGRPDLEVDEALDLVGLGGLESVPFGHLSTGQRRRVSIARLLTSYRPIWLLDEPTSGLDGVSRKQFGSLMQAHLDDGGLIVAATHMELGLNAGCCDLLDFDGLGKRAQPDMSAS